MADVALGIVNAQGPLLIADLADALVAAGATKARNPLQAAESVVRNDSRLITASDGHIFSVIHQLEGAYLSHRVNPFELAHDLLVLDETDWLIELAMSGGSRLASGGTLLHTTMDRLVDIPWDDEYVYGPPPHPGSAAVRMDDLSDEDAVWRYVEHNRWSRVISGPPGWLQGIEADDVVAIRPLAGLLEVFHTTPPEMAADDVAAAVATLRRLGGQDVGAADEHHLDAPDIQALLSLVLTEAPHIVRVPMPPMRELIEAAFPGSGENDDDDISRPRIVDLRTWPAGATDHYNDYMTIKMTATDVKARMLSLLDRVAAGEEIEITKHGRSVARLVPAAGPHALRGSLAGVAMTADPDEDLLGTGEDWNAA